MKRERMTFAVCSSAVLLGSVISFACLMCLAEAFELPCSPQYLVLICCAVSGIAAAVMCLRHSGVFTLGVFALYLAVLIWQHDAVDAGFRTLLYHVTRVYAQCFEGVDILGEAAGEVQWLLGAAAVPLAWVSVWTVCREGHTFLVALICAPVLVLCLMVVDVAPVLWLVLLTAALLLLLLSGSVRLHSATEGGRLIWWLTPPVVILLCALMMLSPVENYVRSDWSTNLQRVAEGNFDFSLWQNKVTSTVSGYFGGELKEVDLGKVGPKVKTGAYAMQYQSSSPIRYLRGSSLGHYEENTWHKVDLPYSLVIDQTQLIRPHSDYETVLIETNVGEPLFYTAYYPTGIPENGMAVNDAYLENPDRVRGYAVRFSENGTAVLSSEYEEFVYETYLQLPGALQLPLTQYLQEQGLVDATAKMIADHVRDHAVYDLNTPVVPDETDFVLHFLNESRRGYCIHFATSTVLLLRSNGIPARYVTGYAVEPTAGQWVEVTQDDAHAWVEFYADGLGWLPLDPTPADESTRTPGIDMNTEEPPDVEQPPADVPDDAASVPTASGAQNAMALTWWLAVPAVLILIPLRRFAILYCRRVQMARGKSNRRALSMFQHLMRLYNVRSMAVPENLICLAEKAKFSQHILTEEELAAFSGEIEVRIAELKKEPFARRLWYRFGPVLY